MSAEPEIVLDLSRLVSRIAHPTPTGVDRCEMAYARGLLAAAPDRLHFAAVHPTGFYGRLPGDVARRFLDVTEERWASRGFDSVWDRRRFVAKALAALRPRLPRKPDPARRRVYLQASPNNLTRPKLIARILDYERAKFVCLLHDVIPLQFPEYATPESVAKHDLRMRTVAAQASGIVANSHATLAAVRPYLDRAAEPPQAIVAHLGTEARTAGPAWTAAGGDARPYFVCIGTIEPRKNHLLLLNLWRRMAEERGAADVPKLVIVGRRGWENEQIVDMLERCPALVGCVEERNGMPDAQVTALLAGARALLFPSFAEGYGMPLTEALGLRVPAICSDIAALREAGGDAPDYLDPLDGRAWQAAIADYATPDSPARTAQIGRMTAWHRPTWEDHVAAVLNLANSVTR